MSKPFPKEKLASAYEPEQFESRVYSYWEETGCFEAPDTPAPGQKTFSIVLPPPNVTGVLHMGHALTATIQDALIRWRRMEGDAALWVPGTDHAGIATQAQVEKAIAKEGKGPTGRPLTRHDLGREKFLERTWKWKDDHASTIQKQHRRLGASLAWSRERFTMDPGISKAVTEVFARLYEEQLIYRGERIINWCPRCQTALSDLEVVPTDRKGYLWNIQYPVVDADGKETGEKLTIATTRPETMLGDTAVAVHPEDERYAHLKGKQVKLPLLNRLIPILFDAYVDREFGTGALKVTPAHDFNDYDLGRKHSLPFIQVMGKDGKITPAGGPYANLKFGEARERICADLKEQGFLIKTEDHQNKVGLCQRCDTIAEPIVSKQWFVKIDPLAKPAVEAVETGKIEFSPRNWEKTYFEWMRNIRDWCISRQLWWGHQIPAWYCNRCPEITVARSAPAKCSGCSAPASELKQDEDVLDTWFSSALWPFATLGWPDKTPALKAYYPNAVMETGFDIIFFWVARMIMMGMHFMGDVPFKKIYLHAMVRDEKGEKMSKSKGNVIDPLEIIAKEGADPLRFTFAIMAGQGRDIKLSLDRVTGYRGFCNKLWNAVKFFHLHFEAAGKPAMPAEGCEAWLKARATKLQPHNAWILSRFQALQPEVVRGLANFELNVSAQGLYDHIWGELCDWYIELSKAPLKDGGEARNESLITLHYALENVLKLAHPFLPHVTEELWQSLPWKKGAGRTLMLEKYPQAQKEFVNETATREIASIRSVIEAIRNFRGENRLSPKEAFKVLYRAQTAESKAFIEARGVGLAALAKVAGFEAVPQKPDGAFAVIPLTDLGLELMIGLQGLVNVEEESKRLSKEFDRLQSDLAHVRKKLGNEAFMAKAPPELVTEQRKVESDVLAKLDELAKAKERLKLLAGK
jgi:valyl-tRNA synthetase